jgi:hypothetical protein
VPFQGYCRLFVLLTCLKAGFIVLPFQVFFVFALEINTKNVPHRGLYLLPKCTDWIYPGASLSCLFASLQRTASFHCVVEDRTRHYNWDCSTVLPGGESRIMIRALQDGPRVHPPQSGSSVSVFYLD